MSHEEYLKDLGSRIKKNRKKQQLSQQYVANLCDMDKSNVSRLESGKSNPTILTLRTVSYALRVPLCDLLEENK